jgi:cytochrome c biogenesis protein ResB
MVTAIIGLIGAVLGIIGTVLVQRKPWQQVEKDKLDQQENETNQKIDSL